MGHPNAIDAVKANSQVYSLLSRFLGQKMDPKKKNAGAQSSLELWRRLGEEYESHTREVAHAQAILLNDPNRM